MNRRFSMMVGVMALLLASPLRADDADHSGHDHVQLPPAAATDHSGHPPSPSASAPAGVETDHSLHTPAASPGSEDAAASPATSDHSAHGAQAPAVPQTPEPSEPEMEDHSGHQAHPAAHSAAHDHGAMHMPVPVAAPVTGPGPVLPVPTAEEVRAAFPELAPHAHMQAPRLAQLLVDRLEAQDADGEAALLWDASAMIGNDFDRLVVTSEGERLHGETEEARHELYWRRAVSRWWESRLGVRHDAGAGPGRDWLAFGVEGLAPFFVEVSAVAYVGENGRSAFTLEAEYDLRLTNRLILQPRLELDVHGRGDAARGLGSGLAGSEAGLRLRYEIRREFAPYLGVEWLRLRGDTADLARTGGERTGEARAVAGFRLWY